jgi:hypothetical protein
MATNGQKAEMVVHTEKPSLAKTEASRAFEPRNVDEGYEMAKLLHASGLLPKAVNKAEAAFAIIATGRELGLPAMQSLRSIHIIDGKPSLAADLIVALVKRNTEVCKFFRLVESTDKVARYETHRVGEPSPTTMTFTIEQAQRAGLTGKDNWKKYPDDMLRARCSAKLARAVYPELVMGLYDPDEIQQEPTVYAGQAQVIGEQPKSEHSQVEWFEKLCGEVDAAETVVKVNSLAGAAARAHKEGWLTDAHLESIKVAVKNKRALIAETTSTPKVPDAEVEREPGAEG